jgi:type IX secretion system PorP/SprF family membrane protein
MSVILILYRKGLMIRTNATIWLLGVLFLFLGLNNTLAQQSFQSSLNQFDKYSMNPAYGGMEDRLSLTGSFRSQWQGLDGHPEFLSLSAHLPFYNLNGAGGFRVRKEDIGVESNTSLLFSYNQVFVFDFGLLSLGARAGYLWKNLDGTALISSSGNYSDGLIDHLDEKIPNVKIRGSAPSWGVGLYFYSNRFDCGIVFDDSPVVAIDLGGIAIQKWRSILMHGNYFLNLSEFYRVDLFATLRSDWVQWQSELGLAVTWSDRFYSSLQLRGYDQRSFDAVSVGFGAFINQQLQLTYSYDLSLSPLRQVSNGTHELMIRYLVDVGIGKKIPEKIIYNPRLYD